MGTSRGRFTAARLAAKSASSGQILIPPRETVAKGNEPIAAQGAYGLVRVTVVGFDLDRAPFLSFPRRAEFWDWILREGGTNLTSLQSNKPREFGSTDDEDQFSLAMRMHGDAFEGVPVVSFGWVAVLIVLYILLIGPVEYFVLKRVLGRLELTWITFPIIVLTVSLAAYYSAYSIKGRDLKINKLDVVEVDPASGRVYGTTWCTIFSPRTDTYTIGVTPGENWGATEPGTEVSWSGSPRGGRASLMRRKYSYHSDSGAIADGLDQVPVQVWSTKSFRANWSSRVDPNAADALAKSDLYHPVGDRQAVVGSFTLNLPVPLLSDCVLLYGGQAMPLSGGTIRTGERIQLVWEKAIPATQWLQKESRLTEVLARVKGGAAPAQQAGPAGAAPPTLSSTSLPLLGILFHEASMQHGEGIVPQNSSLRRFDQTWRLAESHRNEVILVGRAVLPVGQGEETLAGPAAASRLWLKGLPGTGEREPMPRGSTGRQETWVRVYLPVR
ncbi:MAG TPA: hypothetical protein VLM40_16665 [Gemmata sp.]|nr:hypothetical protein [Gemmata sp.]